jgi:hypothetical protein
MQCASSQELRCCDTAGTVERGLRVTWLTVRALELEDNESNSLLVALMDCPWSTLMICKAIQLTKSSSMRRVA